MNPTLGASMHSTLLYITTLIIRHLNIIVHSSACYLLALIRKTETPVSPQLLYISSLNILELIRNIVPIPMMVCKLVGSRLLSLVRPYLLLNLQVTLESLFYVSMILLTVDRLLVVILGADYSGYCTERSAKYVTYGAWFVSLTAGLVVCLLYTLGLIPFQLHPYIHYVHLAFDVVFIIVAVPTYVSLIRWFMEAQSRRRHPEHSNNREINFRLLTQSYLVESILIITSFVGFILITDVVDLVYHFAGIKAPIIWADVRLLLFALSDLFDGGIYVLMNSRVREALMKRLRGCCQCHCRRISSGVNESTP